MKISSRFNYCLDYFRTVFREQYSIYLLIILIVGAFLRFYGIGTEDLWLDEVRTVWFGSKGYDLITAIKRISTDLQAPLYFIVIHFWLYFVEVSETTIRIPSAIFGIISIFYIYKFAAENFNKKTGIFSAIIFAFSPVSLEFSQEARTYSLTVLLTIISFYYFSRLINNKGRLNIIMYVISSTSLIYSHYYAGLILIAQNLYLLSFYKNSLLNIGLWLWIKINSLIFILLIPVTLFLFKYQIHRQKLARGNQENIHEILTYLSGNSLLMIAMVTLSVFCFLFITYDLYKHRLESTSKKNLKKYFKIHKLSLLLFFWLLIPVIIPLIVGFIYKPTYSRRYFLISSVPLYILAALGIDKLNSKTLKFVLIFSIFIFGTVEIQNSYKSFQKPRWKKTTEFIDSHYRDGDLVVIYPSFSINPYNYYAKDGFSPKRFRYFRMNKKQEQMRIFQKQDLLRPEEKKKILSHKRVWMVLRKKDKKSEDIRSFLSGKYNQNLRRRISHNPYNYGELFLYSKPQKTTF